MEARFSAPVQTGPGAHPASRKMGTGSLPGVKSGRGGTLTPHPLLVPWSRKSRAIPLLPLLAVRPVQSLSACTRVNFTFTYYKLFNPLNAQLNPISHLLTLLGAHHILHVSKIRVNSDTQMDGLLFIACMYPYTRLFAILTEKHNFYDWILL